MMIVCVVGVDVGAITHKHTQNTHIRTYSSEREQYKKANLRACVHCRSREAIRTKEERENEKERERKRKKERKK